MIIALYILAALVVTGLIFKFTDRRAASSDQADSQPSTDGEGGECCGMHITCEKDSLLTALADKVEYYDDEELDAYAGRGPREYSAAETEQFRDVLLTLRPEDIAGWARSIQLRGIELPEPVRDELLLIVSEARAALAAGHNANA